MTLLRLTTRVSDTYFEEAHRRKNTDYCRLYLLLLANAQHDEVDLCVSSSDCPLYRITTTHLYVIGRGIYCLVEKGWTERGYVFRAAKAKRRC